MTQARPPPELALAKEPWYHGLLPREEMKVLLTQRGDFLVRFTDPRPGEPRKFVLSVFVGFAGDDIRHYVMREVEGKFAVDSKWFNTIPELLNYYHRTKEPVVANIIESILVRPIGREPWEKLHSDVTLIKKLGEGAFGEVQLGEIRIGTTVKKAAIKLAKLEALSKEQIKEIMHEARLMRKFRHPNVVTFYGVAAGQEPLMVIMELAEHGALDSYLKKNIGCLAVATKNDMILQAARGLEYLHSLQIIHRDIASRNCLYGGGQVKISDFGLSREGFNYRLNPHKKVPIRWLAPEVPRTGFYTPKSDVFAYGIMCWEVYHDGTEPYPGMSVAEVLPRVQDGFRMQFGCHVPEKVARYITERVCHGIEYDRANMMEIVRDLPTIEGFEQVQKSDGYFEVPGEKKKPSMSPNANDVKAAPVISILPYMSQPALPPNGQPGAVQAPQQVTMAAKTTTTTPPTPARPEEPRRSLSNSSEGDVQKKNRKPVPKTPNSRSNAAGAKSHVSSAVSNLKSMQNRKGRKGEKGGKQASSMEPTRSNEEKTSSNVPVASKNRHRGRKKSND